MHPHDIWTAHASISPRRAHAPPRILERNSHVPFFVQKTKKIGDRVTVPNFCFDRLLRSENTGSLVRNFPLEGFWLSKYPLFSTTEIPAHAGRRSRSDARAPAHTHTLLTRATAPSSPEAEDPPISRWPLAGGHPALLLGRAAAGGRRLRTCWNQDPLSPLKSPLYTYYTYYIHYILYIVYSMYTLHSLYYIYYIGQVVSMYEAKQLVCMRPSSQYV